MPVHVVELLGVYALDALDEPEASRVRLHLAECSVCQMEFARFTEVAGRLASLSPDLAPAPDLRRRVLAAAEREAQSQARGARPRWRPRLAWAWASVAVAAVLSQAWLAASLVSMRTRLDQRLFGAHGLSRHCGCASIQQNVSELDSLLPVAHTLQI